MVQCVRGQKSENELGHCQIHEHIWAHPTPAAEKNPALRIDDCDASRAELLRYREAGGGVIVDAQPVAAGRDADMLERLSRESGVDIIASTGYHLPGFYARDCWIHALDEDALTALFLGELREGMLPHQQDAAVRPAQPTAIRAGMVKAAIPAEGPAGRCETLLRAAARAAAASGVPLMLHTDRGKEARCALDICFAAGVRPEKLVVCHVDRQASDFTPHEEIARLGVFLDYDTVGRFKYHDDEAEIALLRRMAPWAGQILLSLDTTAERLGAYGGEIDLTYLLTAFQEKLRRAGFTEAQIKAYNGGNCRRLFSNGIPHDSMDTIS